MQTIKITAWIPSYPGSFYISGAPRVCKNTSIQQSCQAQWRGHLGNRAKLCTNPLISLLPLQLHSAKKVKKKKKRRKEDIQDKHHSAGFMHKRLVPQINSSAASKLYRKSHSVLQVFLPLHQIRWESSKKTPISGTAEGEPSDLTPSFYSTSAFDKPSLHWVCSVRHWQRQPPTAFGQNLTLIPTHSNLTQSHVS